MNRNPVARSEAHGVALEKLRYAEAQVNRYVSIERTSNGNRNLDDKPAYQSLIDARDEARLAVVKANPKGRR